MTRVSVHAWVAMSNHLHLVVTDNYGERPRFMELLNTELAKAASALIGRWGGFWDSGRSYSAVDLLDRNAIIDKLAYVLANPVTSRLVRRACRWPGATSARLNFGDTVVTPRPSTAYYANSYQPKSYQFRLEVPAASPGSRTASTTRSAASRGRGAGSGPTGGSSRWPEKTSSTTK